jgi:hypothetical protein
VTCHVIVVDLGYGDAAEITRAPVTIRSYGPATADKELMSAMAAPR